MKKEIQQRARFDLIRYANCWEDAEILCAALQPAPGKRYLSIASAGDNSFSLIAHGATVVACDLSPAQLACVELRRAAFRRLNHSELLEFLGVTQSQDRLAVFNHLESSLPESSREYWNRHLQSIESGFIHAGKFEAYFRKFRQRVLPLVHSKKKVNQLLEPKTRADRVAFYNHRWNTFRWRILFRVFFSRFVMGRLGRDPEFFRYVEGSVSERILARTQHALTELGTHDNPFLNYILTGNYGNALPHYLKPENFESVREGLDRLILFEGPIQEAAGHHHEDGFDGYNLSDIFEYMDEELCLSIYKQLLDAGRPGARFAYWNMLVPRSCPTELADQIMSHTEQARILLLEDKAWFYSAFVIEEKR